MRKLIKLLTSKSFILVVLLLLQLISFFILIDYLVNVYLYVQIGLRVISMIIAIYIMGTSIHPMYKLSWIIPILVFPVFGGAFYVFYHLRNLPQKEQRRYLQVIESRKALFTNMSTYEDNQTKLLNHFNWFVYEHTKTTFLASGLDKLNSLLIDLKAAQKYIFIEFFIISKSYMFDAIYECLVEKLNQGVEVTIIYDDFGSAFTLPVKKMKTLATMGAKIIAFNKMKLHLNFALNYRNHRKIVVIDGKVGYTGGINIGDEYTGKKEKYGFWQDASIRLEGRAVWSLLLSTLSTIFFVNNENICLENYYIDYKMQTDGIVVPFDDLPHEKGRVTKDLLLGLMMGATKRIWLTTPYLILDNEMVNALKIAKKRGVDVKIIIPSIPDKKLVYMVSQAYSLELIESGIEVYDYTPGFIHSKLSIFDDDQVVIGTSNLDFRSLYLHFENNIYLKNTSSIKDMHLYFSNTLEQSKLKTTHDFKKRGLIYRIIQAVLKGFSPIL